MHKRFYLIILAATIVMTVVTGCIAQPSLIVAATPAATTAQAATPAGSTQLSSQVPSFTNPVEITNPLYPVSLNGRAIYLGTEGGQPFREEITLLPDTRVISWDGQQTEVRVSQYVAYAGGKLVEVAYDNFAQADDGSVYYMGEDVSNYRDGQLVNHEGSWQAGVDGAPPALIMPAHPEVGQIFNPENHPGVAYETDEILTMAEKTVTPAGPIDNGVLIKEILMDGSIEHKVNAANFGIVESRAEDEQVNLVWLNRTDAEPGTVPEPLDTIEIQAEDIIDRVPAGEWETVSADLASITEAWQVYQTQVATEEVPQPFQEALTAALDRLQTASTAKDATGTMQAASDLSAALLDLFVVYHPTTPTDLGSLDVLERQVILDAAANDFTAAADGLAKIDAVWGRLKPVLLAQQGSDAVVTQWENSVMKQREALNAGDTTALTAEANNALALVDEFEYLF